MVTAIVNNPGMVAGQVIDWTGARSGTYNKAGTFAVNRGDILVKDTSTAPDSWKIATAGASIVGPFVMALEAAASAALVFRGVEGGYWCVKADGTIEIGDEVQMSTATNAITVTFVQSTVSGSPTQTEVQNVRDDRKRVVGKCLGFADNWNTGLPTAPVVNDLYVLDANAGFRL